LIIRNDSTAGPIGERKGKRGDKAGRVLKVRIVSRASANGFDQQLN